MYKWNLYFIELYGNKTNMHPCHDLNLAIKAVVEDGYKGLKPPQNLNFFTILNWKLALM